MKIDPRVTTATPDSVRFLTGVSSSRGYAFDRIMQSDVPREPTPAAAASAAPSATPSAIPDDDVEEIATLNGISKLTVISEDVLFGVDKHPGYMPFQEQVRN